MTMTIRQRAMRDAANIEREMSYASLLGALENAIERYLTAEDALEKSTAMIAQLRGSIAEALTVAGGRWSEWGDRAVSAAEILDAVLAEEKP